MPAIRPIGAVQYAVEDGDVTALISPPYDVLDAAAKARLLAKEPHNIVAVDLPHLPAKTVGPDETYAQAGATYRHWIEKGVLTRRSRPALFAYQQTYRVNGRQFKRRGLMCNVRLQPFGEWPGDGAGAIHPHEQTFSGPKEDRLKLMRATAAQLSPIFGLYSHPTHDLQGFLHPHIRAEADLRATTAHDGVLHELWTIDDPGTIEALGYMLNDVDVFIADGHHRYTTALNYRSELESREGPLAADHPANYCLFVLVSMQDPGLVILPTHRVLGGMSGGRQRFNIENFAKAAEGRLKLTPFPGTDLSKLEAALPRNGPHAIGIFNPADPGNPLAIATTVEQDPLAAVPACRDRSPAWRQLDVAIVQHLIVEQICQPNFCPSDGASGSGGVSWKFPHTLDELRADAVSAGYQLGLVVQPTPLEAVRRVSEAGELMPQKSTFFYPKIATGLAINPLT